jgi:hypothetical protein
MLRTNLQNFSTRRKMMMSSTVNLLALGALLILLLASLRWVFGAPKPKRSRSIDVVRGAQRADGSWERASTRSRESR